MRDTSMNLYVNGRR